MLPKPAELPESTDDLFILMHWTVSWELGKFESYRPTARKYKYSIVWDDGRRNAKLLLEKYYESPMSGEAGNWVLLKKTTAVGDGGEGEESAGRGCGVVRALGTSHVPEGAVFFKY